MSKIVKAVTKPLGLSGGGGKKNRGPSGLTGSARTRYVEAAKQKFGPGAVPGADFAKSGDWGSYVNRINKMQAEANRPEPQAFEMPSFSFEFPDYSNMFQRPADARSKPAAAKTVAERIKEEAEQFANVKAGEKVFSAAQGVSTRLRAAVSQEEDKAGGTKLGESAGTLLGRRGTGGATSFRRKRISRY